MKTKVTEIELIEAAGPGTGVGSAHFGVSPGKVYGLQIAFHTQPVTCLVMITNTLGGIVKTIWDGNVTDNTDIELTGLSELLHQYDGTIGPTECPPIVSGAIEITVANGDDADPGVIVTLLLQA